MKPAFSPPWGLSPEVPRLLALGRLIFDKISSWLFSWAKLFVFLPPNSFKHWTRGIILNLIRVRVCSRVGSCLAVHLWIPLESFLSPSSFSLLLVKSTTDPPGLDGYPNQIFFLHPEGTLRAFSLSLSLFPGRRCIPLGSPLFGDSSHGEGTASSLCFRSTVRDFFFSVSPLD